MVTPADESKDLRRGVDYVGVGCMFIVHDGNGCILLQKRGLRCRDEQGRWDVGGGAVEFGEPLEDTVKREIQEELCTEPIRIEFLTTYDAHRQLDDGTPTHWVAIVWAVQVDPAEVSIGEPHKIDELGWFNSSNLPSPLHSQFDKSFTVAIEKGIVK